MQATVQKNHVTKEGFIVDNATGGVIGFKCNGCSTAHVPTEDLTQNQFVDFIFNAQETHQFC